VPALLAPVYLEADMDHFAATPDAGVVAQFFILCLPVIYEMPSP
jgi:hypothetical protein